MGFGEENYQGAAELIHLLLEVEVFGFHLGKHEGVIKSQKEHEDAEDEENDHPRCGDRLE